MKRKRRLPFLWKCLSAVCVALMVTTGLVIAHARATRDNRYTCLEYEDRTELLDVNSGLLVHSYSRQLPYQFISTEPPYILKVWDWREHGFPYSKIEVDTNDGQHAEIQFSMREVHGWAISADHRYYPIQDSQTHKIYLYSLPNLALVETFNTDYLIWANQGHQFITFDKPGYVAIHSPGDAEPAYIPFHDPNNPYWTLLNGTYTNWSPNGKYLHLVGYRRYTRHLPTEFIDRIVDMQTLRSWYVPGRTSSNEIPDFSNIWYLGGEGWLYREALIRNKLMPAQQQLKVLHLDSGKREVITSDLGLHSAFSRDGHYLALSVDGRNKHSIDVYDLKTMSSWSLIDGADDLVGEPTWVSDNQVVVAWTSGVVEFSNYTFHLTWADADSKNNFEIENQWLDARNFQLLPSFGLVYSVQIPTIAHSRSQASTQVMLTDFKTHSSVSLGEATLDTYLAVSVSPDEQTYIISFEGLTERKLVLMRAADDSQRHLPTGDVTWSPDSTFFTLAEGKGQMQIFQSDGTLMFTINAYSGMPVAWTRCD